MAEILKLAQEHGMVLAVTYIFSLLKTLLRLLDIEKNSQQY